MHTLNIPPDILQRILPRQTLSISDFLSFPIQISAPNPPQFTTQETYISTMLPDATPEELDIFLSSATPPLPLLQELVSFLQVNHDSDPDARSLACQATQSTEVKYFPLWVITYWNALQLVCDARKCWETANRSLQKLSQDKGTAEVVMEVRRTLEELEWYGSVRGFSDSHEIDCLHKYMTTAWLGTIHEEQMLDLLQADLIDHYTDPDAIIIEDTDFIRCLRLAFDRRYTRPGKGGIHKRGTALARGDHRYLATIANCFECHWVAIIIDFRTCTIWHGDSLGWEIDPNILALLEWWTTEHGISKFTANHLPITHQSDTFSCGLLAWNALANFFLPRQFPLIAAEKVAAERLQLFLRISDHHQQHIKLTAQTDFDYAHISLHSQASKDTEDSDFDMLESSFDEDGQPSQSNQSDISDVDDDDMLPITSNLAGQIRGTKNATEHAHTQKIQVE
jgi:hypothetical protein